MIGGGKLKKNREQTRDQWVRAQLEAIKPASFPLSAPLDLPLKWIIPDHYLVTSEDMSISCNDNLAGTVDVHFKQQLEIVISSIINIHQVTLKDSPNNAS